MKTSLLIPTFNEAKYLPKLLDSLLIQTQLPDEIIICDNASTDHTLTVAKSYQSKLPLIIINQPVKGIIPTMEKLWRHASGDVLLKVDADSILPRHWVKKVTTHFITDPNLSALSGPWISADGNLIEFLYGTLGSSLGNLLFQLVNGYQILLGPNSAFRRTALVDINGYSFDKPSCDDQIISQKLYQSGHKFKHCLHCYNFHSTRRWHHNPKSMAKTFLSFFDIKYYIEKQV